MLETFYNLLENTLNERDSNYGRREEFQSYLCLILQTIINNAKFEINQQIADTLVDIVFRCFRSRGDVFDDAFMLISSLCVNLEQSMDKHSSQIGPYIFHALKEKEV